MLTVTKNKKQRTSARIITLGAVLALTGGVYLLSLVSAPVIMPYVVANKIDPKALASPRVSDNRIIIPKIGVDIPYGKDKAALDAGAQWRYPERGSPEKGGNFIIAAHRFELAVTPQATLAKSPFYHVDKLTIGDQIVIDYDGSRYGYEITRIYDVKPAQVEIEAPSESAKLTLYTCSLGGSADGRVVVEAAPLGEVKIDDGSSQ